MILFVIGAVVVFEARRLGAGWTSDGPGAGYFPFYIGLILCMSALGVIYQALVAKTRDDGAFVDRVQMGRVLSVLVPAAVYVLAIWFLGLYVASAIYIALFMIILGKYPPIKSVVLAVIVGCRLLHDVRGLVQGAAVQGHARAAALPRLLIHARRVPETNPMEELSSLMQGFAVVLTPMNIGLMFVGIILGVLIGVLPGLGGANGVAILLPLTFSMSPTSAIVMLSCIYWGALFGGAITSILFNIPGEPWSVATTFDGYPMAQKGKAGQALTAAFTSSFIGAFVAVLMITFLAPMVAKFALKFGAPEFFAVYLLTFCSFVGMGKGSPFKILIAMALGFALAAVGMDTVTGQLRLTFGQTELMRGFDFLIAVIGLFGIGEILLSMEEGLEFQGKSARINPKVVWETWKETAQVLGHVDAQLAGRHLDGHHPGRRHAGLVHELRPGQEVLQERREVRHRRDRGRDRAGDRGACRRHQRACCRCWRWASRARRPRRCCSAAC